MTTIIKAHGEAGERDGARCAAFNLEDFAEQANRYLADVRRQAEALLAQARQEAEQIRRQAAEQGRTDALKTARQQAAAQSQSDLDERLQSLLPALTAAAAEIRQSKAAWRRHWEGRVVALAAAMAERVLRRELERAPEISLELIRESLELAAGAGRVVLHLNPRDLETLGPRAQAVAAQSAPDLAVELASDQEVSPGGCRLTSNFGEIDQRIESQLARIQEELTG